MIIPVEWAAEVCLEADRVLAEDKKLIRGGEIGGLHWAAHCYERAVERVAKRVGRT